MRCTKRKTENGRETDHALTCPHCGAGEDEKTVGLYWESDERCWRCIICGYRGYECTPKSRTQIETVAEKIWDEIINALDKEHEEPVLK